MKKLQPSQDYDDFGIRVDYEMFETPVRSRPSSGAKIGFQLNATPIFSGTPNGKTVSKLNFENQRKLPSSSEGTGLRNSLDIAASKSYWEDSAASRTNSRRQSVASGDRSKPNSRPCTASTVDIGGGESRRSSVQGSLDTRRSSLMGGLETRRSSIFGGSETRRSSVFGAGTSSRSTASSRSAINDVPKDFGSVDLLRNEIILTNGNLSGLIHIVTNFLWLATGDKRFGSKSVKLVMPQAFTNASLFHDDFARLATYCCQELKNSSTLHSYISELIVLATWKRFKTRMLMFFLFGSIQGPLSPDQRKTSKEFGGKLQELAYCLCGNLDNIQFQAILTYDVFGDHCGLEEHMMSMLERSNNGIAEAPPPEFSIAVDQFVRNQAQSLISSQLSDVKIDLERNLLFPKARFSKSDRFIDPNSAILKLETDQLQDQVNQMMIDRAPYWPAGPDASVLKGGSESFVREMIRSAEKESLRAKNTLEALTAAQNKILTLEKKLASNKLLENAEFQDFHRQKSTKISSNASTPNSRKASLVSSLRGLAPESLAKSFLQEPKRVTATLENQPERSVTQAQMSLETSKYQLTTGIEGVRIIVLADSMKGTSFEYSGQFETGKAGLLTRHGSGRCEWKSPGGFHCWYVGDWQNDRPHGWGRSGRGALVESGIFEDGRLSLKGWPEILDGGTQTIVENPRWPAQRGRSESTIPETDFSKFPSARISPPAPPPLKKPPWYQRLSSTTPDIKEEKVLPAILRDSTETAVSVDQVQIALYKPFCCFWSEGSCEKCPSDGDSMSLSEAYRMACIASHLAQENFATNLEKEQKSGLFVLVCTHGNERCNIVLFGNKLEGLPHEYAGAVSPQTRMRHGFGICIWKSVVYGSCWFGGKWEDDQPCGWGRAGFGVGAMKGSAPVPSSAVYVCGWFGKDVDQSAQKWLVDEDGKTIKAAPGQYAPNSRLESLAREHYESARDAAENAKKLQEVDKSFAGEQISGRIMRSRFHSSRWSRTKIME